MIDDEKTTLTDAYLTGKAALYRYIATFFVQHEEIEDTLQQTYVDALSSQQEKGVRIDSLKGLSVSRGEEHHAEQKKRQQIVFFENVGVVDDTIASGWQQNQSIDLVDAVHSQDQMQVFYDAVETLPPSITV